MRMKYHIFLIFYIYLKIHVETSLVPSTLEEYSHEKLIALSLKQEERLKRNLNNLHEALVDYWDNNDSWKFVYSFNAFNESYTMLDGDFHKTFGNKFIIVRPVAEIIPADERITKADVLQIGNELILMYAILNEKYLRIVKFEYSILKYQDVQTIEHVHITDVKFFQNQGKIYLIISSGKNNYAAPTSVYEWRNNQFDEIINVHLVGISKIATFPNGNSAIISLLQHEEDESFCLVYEFENGNWNKKQVIKVDRPNYMLTYNIENEQFVLFLNNHIGSIYHWRGEELIGWSTQKIDFTLENVQLAYLNNIPIIIDGHLNKANVYKLSKERMDLIKTIPYSHELTKLLDVQLIKNNSRDLLMICGNTEDTGIIEAYNITFESEKIIHNYDPIYNCLSSLEDKLNRYTFVPNTLENLSAGEAKPLPVFASMKMRNHIELEDEIDEIQERYLKIRKSMEELNNNDGTIIINGSFQVNGTLQCNKLTAGNINFVFLNDQRWTPDRWLSYTKNQTISGGIDAETLNIVNLQTTPEVQLFDDLLLNNSESTISGQINLRNLNADNIFVNEINNIKLDDVFMRDRDSLITGTKMFKHLTAGSVETARINQENSRDVVDQLFSEKREGVPKFHSNVFIKNLEVEDIDGVNWNTFKHSVFRYGISKSITGNLLMKQFKAENLNVNFLNDLNPGNFMTTSTDQIVKSAIEFKNIFASNITARKINGISIPEDVAVINRNTIVKGPVSIENIHIRGDLHLNYSLDDSSFLKKNEHIVGTDESDLLQLYTEKIKIVGNLRVRNLKTNPLSTIILGENEEFNPHLHERYWMKNRNQQIPDHVEAINGLTTPHLQTKLLNEIGMASYLVNNTNVTLSSSFKFENATFLGNVFLNNEMKHSPDLPKIDAESVKVNGSFVIYGRKIFKDSLKIKSLITDELNDLSPKNFVKSGDEVKFSAKKNFEKLIINGDFISNHSTEMLNDVNLEELEENAVYINVPQRLDMMNFTSVSIENLDVKTLNGRPIDEYMAEINDLLDRDVIDRLIINGKLTIGNLLNVSKINEKSPDVLNANRIKFDEQNILHGHVRFIENVTIDNLSATFINKINFPLLTSRLFYRNGNQTIPARFTFENLKTRNLITPKINEFNMSPLVNIRSNEPQVIIAPNGLQFNSASLNVLHSEEISPCNIDIAMEKMQNPPTQVWSNIRVFGNVTILDEQNPLSGIVENAVLANEKNIISAQVTFSNISTDNLEVFKHINDIDLKEILSDALWKQSENEQIVSGMNKFERLGVYSAIVQNNSDIAVVNGIEIPKLSSQIIKTHDIIHGKIRGTKTFFEGLQTGRIKTETVSNILPENLVTIHDVHRVIPKATFENVEIENNLSIDRINDQDFNFFLNGRLLTSSDDLQEVSSICSFNDVHIAGNVTTPAINDIDINDVVFDVKTQEITGKKAFLNDVHVIGNIDIDRLNGYEISEIFEKVTLRNEESFIESNVEITRPSIVNGTIKTEFINGYPLEEMKQILATEASHPHEEKVAGLLNSIQTSMKKNYEMVERIPSEIMYIEKSDMIQLSFPNTINAQSFRVKNYVLIHIIGEQQGDLCGLPRECQCPVQYTLQISPENSINFVTNKGTQRVYSYDDGNMTSHFITDSISIDNKCKSNNTLNERSTLAWNTVDQNRIFSHPMNFTSYISSVEYFTVNGKTYMIIGRYYDPLTNSKDLDCVVMKFDENRSSVSEIQKIPTVGVMSLKIFATHIGDVVLIVGVEGKLNKNEKTLFMRFDKLEEKFVILREVQDYGCSSSVGIVVGNENFIALAHKRNPVLIFKYDAVHDNYKYYQNLHDPLPIRSISVFYSGGSTSKDAYLCVVSERGVYGIYNYEYVERWQRKFYGEINGLKNLIPFELNNDLYLFAPSTNMSSVLSVVKFSTN